MEFRNCDQSDAAVQPKCPLCGSADTFCETRINTGSILGLYGKVWRELVRHELQGKAWIYVYHCRSCFLCFFEPKTPGSPAFYKSLQSFEWYYLKDKAEYEMAKKWISPNMRVLEVGCGAGWFAKRLLLTKYTGLEYSESAAEEATNGGLDVRTQSVQEYSLTHQSAYQVVCAFQVLEHVVDLTSFIAACVDCLEPGGLLIYAVPSDDSYLQFLQNAALNLPPHHLTRWPDKTLEAITRSYPVDLVAIEHEVVSDIHLRTCVSTMIKRRLDLLFCQKGAIVDRSISARLLGRCSNLLARWIASIFEDEAFRPKGHTVIATYRKHLSNDSK
jgi:2-polyprenyl-3-methyl-5-hydroxy-6-metoxy-1,4-benzoquinol methylase